MCAKSLRVRHFWCRIFRGAVGGLVLRVVIPVAAVTAVLVGLRAVNKRSGKVSCKLTCKFATS